jgi:queuine tRNA-ribosyltransferase
MQSNFIPIATSQAGTCLTSVNWQEIGIDTQVYYLDALLMKPGYPLLKTLPSLQSYCGWTGTLVINASMLSVNSEGIISLRSLYDGSQLRFSQQEIISLINNLQPDCLILPPILVAYLAQNNLSFPETIKLFIPANEHLGFENFPEAGIYLSYDKSKPFADFLLQFNHFKALPTYLSGDFNVLQIQELSEAGATWIESDKPAKDALLGQVYSDEGIFNLAASEMANQHKPLNADCNCPVCTQVLTRAYLHQLFLYTPLLGQRLLIQHNAYFYQTLTPR